MTRWIVLMGVVVVSGLFAACGEEDTAPADPSDAAVGEDFAEDDSSILGGETSQDDAGPEEVSEPPADAETEVSEPEDAIQTDSAEDAGVTDVVEADAEIDDAAEEDVSEIPDVEEEIEEPEEPAIPLEECIEQNCPDEYTACDAVPNCSSVIFCMNICEQEHTPHCGDDECGDDEDHESCPQDCPAPVCGDWQCNGDEDAETCPEDCYEPVCGDGLCEGFESFYCDEDCETECGNGVCETWEENYVACPDDCDAPVCGNGFCQEDDGEDYVNCLDDCPAPVCGDGECTADETEETCADDCTGGGWGGGGGGGGGGGFGGGGEDDLEPWMEEMNACFESCMMSASGATPVPEWGSLETCADGAGCIDLGAITGEEEEGGMMGGMMGGGMMGGGTPECGNGVCQFEDGEDAATCPDDCEGVEPPECSDTNPCGYPAFCESGSCTCPDEYFCDAECVDIQTHLLHCGECGNKVPEGGTCDGGYATCPGDQLICGETCADLETHAEHCGSCFEACVAGAICIDGGCKGTPPRPVAPLSGVTISSRRPVFEVELPDAGDATQITVCSDRLCQEVVQVFSVVGPKGKPPEDLPSGALFWYSQTKAAGIAGQETSVIWSLYVPNTDAPVDSNWGSSMDFNQDGFSDVAIGSCGSEGCTSSIFVHYSNPDGGISSTPDSEVSEPAGGAGGFGASLASAGDTDGNGFPEMLLGTSSDSKVYHYGNSNGGLSPGPTTSWAVPAGTPSMSSAGDVDRDGYGDIVISGT
ncbi:MAG: FG-GAP-like repeat-containing protein, partial [Myxococcota bacterium]|nr:FG-GAP-like repeat-containing protein [Myxococcota bacterium]